MASYNQPPQEAVAALPIVNSVLAAFASVALQLGLVAQAGRVAFLMLIAASLLSMALPGPGNAVFFMFLVGLAAASHFGLSWCRVMLLGPSGLPARPLAWRPPHWSFLGYILLTALLMVLVTFPMSIVGSILGALLGLTQNESLGPMLSLTMMLVLLGMCYVVARIGFVFPATAVEETYSLAHAVQHSAGVGGLRIAAALALAGLPIVLVQLVITELLLRGLIGTSLADIMPQMPADGGAPQLSTAVGGKPPTLVAVILFDLISTVVNLLSMAVIFSLLCLAFGTCTGWVPATENLPAEPEDGDSDQNGSST